MALNFPSSPNVNATYTFSDKTWTYNGNAWALASTTLSTNVVVEGTNLYFTDARVYSNVVQLGYITSSALSGYATNTQINSYATNAQLASYATNAQLTSYATTSNLALKANIVDLNTSNITEGTNLYFSNARSVSATVNSTLSNITVSGNITTGNVVVTGASRLGTVTSGTWSGANISTTYTDAKIVSVSNTSPILATTSSGAVTVSMANSGVSANTYGSGLTIPVFSVDQYGRITGVTDTQITASGTGGFTASTTTVFPGHSGNVDYGDLTSITADAFGVSLGVNYDCMEPNGSIVSEDLAVL